MNMPESCLQRTNRRTVIGSMVRVVGACLGTTLLAHDAAPADTLPVRTIANGNLLMRSAMAMIPVTLPQQEDTLNAILTQLFQQARVRFVLDPDTSAFKCGAMCNRSPFKMELASFMFGEWDCSLSDGGFSVFKRAITGIVPGRPDLDTARFTRETRTYTAVRPFIDGVFREANLRYVLSPDCPEFMPGIRFKGHFRELLKCSLGDKLTFEVRDGVYYISPKPDGYV